MKKLILITLALILASCAGVRYADKPALEFEDIDYGFDVHYAFSDEHEMPRIAYIDEGSGDKTLLLVHGLASNAGFWRYNITALSRDFRVIAVDLPGYGKSQKGDYPYGMKFWAEMLDGFIAELGLENVVYVGHSMGGQIGITLSIEYPDAIDELVLAAPAGIESFSPGSGDWLASVFTMHGVKNTTEPAIRENLSINFYRWNSRWEWMVEERVRMAKAREMDEFAYTVVQSINAMLDEPTSHRLHQVNHPTLIVYGEYDGLIPNRFLNPGFPSAVFQKGHEAIPNSTLVELRRAGHMLMIERPDAFNVAVATFARSN
ncbi:MAG: alpha/beta hydrolase [Balneolia bacterium]|nr:alpha/beta hydrolase [Balneolia bacterium]